MAWNRNCEHTREELNNHANQCNPNNRAYYASRQNNINAVTKRPQSCDIATRQEEIEHTAGYAGVIGGVVGGLVALGGLLYLLTKDDK